MSDEAVKKFQTYLFFLRHFDLLVRQTRDDDTVETLVSGLLEEQHPLLANIQPKALTPARLAILRRMMFNAWNSETVARINSLFAVDVRVITNQWKPVQVYYALYFLLAGVHELYAPGQRRGHEATLRFATNTISYLFPHPWRCYYDFDSGDCHRFAWQSTPQVASGWNLANHPDANVFVVHFYRTTGTEKRYERWLENGKKKKHRLGHERSGKAIRIKDINGGTIGFWDVLWRMRKWVNYKEAQALLEGQQFLPHVEEFDSCLNSILTASAAVVEHVLYTLIGDEQMTEMYDSYLAVTSGKVDCSALQVRRDVLCGLPF